MEKEVTICTGEIKGKLIDSSYIHNFHLLHLNEMLMKK